MLISLCGTPGTGKTTASEHLSRAGPRSVGLTELIHDLSLHEGTDPDTGEMIVDAEAVRAGLESWRYDQDRIVVLEGHLSYLAPSDLCLLLRTHPSLLRERLKAKGYGPEKIEENVEAEAVSFLLFRCMEEEERALKGRKWEELPSRGRIVLERDVSNLDPEGVAGWMSEMIDAYRAKRLTVLSMYRPGKVDWLEVHGEW